MPIRVLDIDFGEDLAGLTLEPTLPEDLPVAAAPEAPLEPVTKTAPMRVVTTQELTAVLRWRTRWLRSRLSNREAMGLRLIPALLQASFATTELRQEPPGVEGMTSRQSWASLAAAFELPPPIGRQRGRRLVNAILATQAGKNKLEIYVVSAPGLGSAERTRLDARMAAIEEVVKSRGLPFQLAVLTWEKADLNTEPLLRLIAFGALLAGRLPEAFWGATGSRTLSHESLVRVIERAPTPLCTLASLMLLGGRVPEPAAAMRMALQDKMRVYDVADPEIFAASWASLASDDGLRLFRALAVSKESPRQQKLCADAGRCPPSGPPSKPAELVKLGNDLLLSAIRAFRKAPPNVQAKLKAFVKREVLSHGIPDALLPTLARNFRALETECRGAPLFVKERTPTLYEACDTTGLALTRGATPEQAMLRALVVLARALDRMPNITDPAWLALGTRVTRPSGGNRSLLLALEATDEPGSPHDPLNRGPERKAAFKNPLSITLRPNGRPSARVLSPRKAIERMVAESASGTLVDAVAITGESHPLAARMMRVARQARASVGAEVPLAIEAGGRVILMTPSRVRSFPLKKFAARPRQCNPDPEAPDLSPWAEDRLTRSPFGGSKQIINCRVSRIGQDRAAILYMDSDGYQLYEEVPLPELERYLADGQAILRERPSAMLLMVRYAKELENILGRQNPNAAREGNLDFEVMGKLPHGLQISLMGEQFGAGLGLGWRAAAQSILSVWPAGSKGMLRCKAVNIDVGDKPAVGLLRLYARAVTMRRLKLHVGKSCPA